MQVLKTLLLKLLCRELLRNAESQIVTQTDEIKISSLTKRYPGNL